MAPRWIERLREKPPGDQTPVGRSGTINTRGFLTDREQNALLVWPQNLDVYEEMRRTDATIKWMLSLISTPIRAASWRVEEASDSDEDQEIAAFVHHALFQELEGGFDEFLRQALLMLTFGHSVFERVAEMRPLEFSWEKEREAQGEAPETPIVGAPAPKNPEKTESQTFKREVFVISKLGPRLPRTIFEWVPSVSDSSQLDHIVQYVMDGQTPDKVSIPASRLIVFTNEKEGDDWRGTSILRSAYKSYRFKQKLENLEAIAYERSAGLPVVYPPQNANPADIDAVEKAVKSIRQGESLYLIMPGPKQGLVKEVDGWVVEDLAIDADGGRNSASEAIQRYEGQIARNVLAEFMRLGHIQSGSGSRSTAEVTQDPYYQSIEAYVNYIEDVINEQVIRPMVAWNYDVVDFPKIKASKMQAKNITIITNAIAQLGNAGALSPDPKLENWLRDLIDAPERGANTPPPPGLPAPGQAGIGPDGGSPEPATTPTPGKKPAGTSPKPGQTGAPGQKRAPVKSRRYRVGRKSGA